MSNAIFIGRFQPFHVGHLDSILSALEKFNSVTILVGSANRRRSPKNPFTYEERKHMILGELKAFHGRIEVFPLNDYLYDEVRWEAEVRDHFSHVRDSFAEQTTHIIAYEKDESSYYLHSFPELEMFVPAPTRDGNGVINATDIRRAMFNEALHTVTDIVLPSTLAKLKRYSKTEYFRKMQEEIAFNESETSKFKDYPYKTALNCLTADAVVVCAGHLLVVERAQAPGAGCLALPGGFVDCTETMIDAAIRELKEETRLKVPEKILRGNIKATHFFDHPSRSEGAVRKATMATYIEIKPNPDGTLPRVKGSDDAAKAVWLPVNEVLKHNTLFDDHECIVRFFTKI